MGELLEVKRMLELEEMARTSDIKYPLSLEEWRYIERAEKMPFDEIVNSIENYNRNFLIMDQISFINKLLTKYSVTEKELEKRFNEIYRIRRYKNGILNQQLKTQKQMVKRMNRF